MNANPGNVLAVFDLDGTLVRGDCLLPFVVGYARARRKYLALLGLSIHVGMYVARLTRDHVAKERVLVSILRGEHKPRVSEYAAKFCESWVRPKLRVSVVARLREHQESGHRVLLLSASPDVYVLPIAQMLGIAEVICTRVRSDGEHWDGRLVGRNCKGEDKLIALRNYIGIDSRPTVSYAYGDSISDMPVLKWTSNGFMVGRDGTLVQV